MSIQKRVVEYTDGQIRFEGLIVWDDSAAAPRPGVLVAHTIRGRTAFEESKATALAELGYVGFAIDVYGLSQQPRDDAACRAQMEELLADRPELQNRMSLSMRVLQEQSPVDDSRIAAIGFCFGGLCVLDLARTGSDLAGVVSFHGLLDAPANTGGASSKP